MRHHFITLHGQDPRLRWVHFDRGRPWLDAQMPDVDLTVQCVAPGAAALCLAVVDRCGDPCAVEPLLAVVPKGRHGFLGQLPETRQVWRGRIRFPGPQPVWLVDTASGDRLLELRPEVLFPAFLFALLQELRTDARLGRLRHFVETGTLFGHTTLHASHWFDDVTTIELSPELCAEARHHLAHRENVTCLEGDSGDLVGQVVAGLDGAALFFLDAHWSGDASVTWEGARFSGYPVDTARLDRAGLDEADRQVPLLAELETIARDHRHAAVVLIDDWGGVGRADFAFPGEDWRNLDRGRLLDWFESHPRTRTHHPLDSSRYVWRLDPLTGPS